MDFLKVSSGMKEPSKDTEWQCLSNLKPEKKVWIPTKNK